MSLTVINYVLNRLKHHHVRVGRAVYHHVEMDDMLTALTGLSLRKQVTAVPVRGLGQPQGAQFPIGLGNASVN